MNLTDPSEAVTLRMVRRNRKFSESSVIERVRGRRKLGPLSPSCLLAADSGKPKRKTLSMGPAEDELLLEDWSLWVEEEEEEESDSP